MLFVCPSTYRKKPEAEDLDAHRAWLKQAAEDGRLVSAGRRDGGEGGLVILRAESMDEAQAILGEDPFAARGVAAYEPMGFTPGIGELQG
ncbi:MAG: YciI family protein [Pseudomonadota bacterium]